MIYIEKHRTDSQPIRMDILDSIFAKMVLNKAIRDFRRDQILREVDQTLEERNKEKFFQLIEELKSIS
ncbi:IDEAL domain-containing protein [Priestia sp. TRN 1309]|uniref:IDEAL domain-containing protein n=1 Tax=Priestia sp. TRN 1309 TaxID=3420729 RepID=UPI003D784EBE